jgi:DNA-binding NarL/FixJ family response regulator
MLSKQTRILLSDDHVVVRQGLLSLLNSEVGLQVVGEASNGREAVELVDKLLPDVVVMDIALPILNGLEATKKIIKAHPQIKVLMLSGHNDEIYIEMVRTVGASGYLVKQSSIMQLAQAIRQIQNGAPYFNLGPLNPLAGYNANHRIKTNSRLSMRELEVLQLVAEGKANKQAASELNISIKTVEKHRQNLMEKLGIHETAGLTRYAISAGVIESYSFV